MICQRTTELQDYLLMQKENSYRYWILGPALINMIEQICSVFPT